MIYRSDDIYKKTKNVSAIKDEQEFLDLIEAGEIDDADLLLAFSDLRLKLGQNFKLDHISFVTGNGCSIYAGSKSTLEFQLTDAINEEELADIDNEMNKISGKPLEEQLNALLTIQEYYSILGDIKEKTVANIIKELKTYLLRNYVNSVDYNNLMCHEALLLKLRSFGCLKKVNLYTLNYDMAWEYILDKLSIYYDNGFAGFVNRKFDPRKLQTSNTTKLIKIHGSVNWVYDVEDQTIKEVQPKFRDGKADVDDAEHVLIYPTEQKLYQTYDAPYSELMRSMLDGFESGRNLILVLGYKYGDEHINEILFKAVANPNNVFYFFDYDDKNCEFIKRMTELSESTHNINILLGKFLGNFTNFVKFMMPANAEKTDEERIFELLGKVLNHD